MDTKTICSSLILEFPYDDFIVLKLVPEILVTARNEKEFADVYMHEVLVHSKSAAGAASRVS